MFKESRCKKNRFCSFEQTNDYPDATKEICIYCGRKKIWYKDETGRIDNRKYLRFHLRDTCQPKGLTEKVFLQVYGREKQEKLLKQWAAQGQDISDTWDQRHDLAEKDIKELRKERQTL